MVVATATYAAPGGAGATGAVGATAESGRLDPLPGALLRPRASGPAAPARAKSGDVAASVVDPVSGWTVTQALRRPPMGSCG